MVREKSHSLMVLVVAYNAEQSIVHLLDRIPKEIWLNAKEIVVADDCSSDETAKVAEEYKRQKKVQNLTVVRHDKNKGYGGNQKWGYSYALQKKYDFVAMLHGDVQYAPEDIPRLLKPLEENKAEMVFGSRIAGHPLKGGMPLYKFLGNKFLTTTQNIILRKKFTEYHSGFRIYATKAFKKIPLNACSDDFHFDTEIMVQLLIANQRIAELPIQTHYGDEKCYVKVIPYGMNVLRTMGSYLLARWGIINSSKFSKNYFPSQEKFK
jgi:glycosyltransferase involved in cell wall biosynthesis